jgi:hypothetical protein
VADNVTANPGSGGPSFAADDIGGVYFPRTKLALGADGVNDGDVSSSNPLPVTGPLTDAQLRAAAVSVSGPLTDAQLRASEVPVSVAGDMIEAIEAMRFAIMSLVKTLGYALPNAQGFPIMEVRQGTAANLNATVSGTVTSNIGSGTLALLTNQTQIGGFNANDQIPALMHLQADNLRRNLAVT